MNLREAILEVRRNPLPPPRSKDALGPEHIRIRETGRYRRRGADLRDIYDFTEGTRSGKPIIARYLPAVQAANDAMHTEEYKRRMSQTTLAHDAVTGRQVGNPRKVYADGSPGRYSYYYPTSSECLEYASGRLKPVNRRTKRAIAARNWMKAINEQARHRYRLQAR